jgi:tetratricopeptide (TPR) repeat protein
MTHGAAVALALLLATSPVRAATPLLQQAIQAYESLEYESALNLLNQARDAPMLTPRDQATIYMYLGLVRFSKGERDLADQSFRQALDIDPTLQLPAHTSPKIVERFDVVKAKRVAEQPTRSHTGAWIAAGATVALAGTGVVFGVLAHKNANDFDAAQFADDAQRKKESARTDTHLANVFYGVAGAAAVTAIVLYIIEDHTQPAATQTVSVAAGPTQIGVIARF